MISTINLIKGVIVPIIDLQVCCRLLLLQIVAVRVVHVVVVVDVIASELYARAAQQTPRDGFLEVGPKFGIEEKI